MAESSVQYNAVMLAHAGEIGIKSKTTRKFMIKQLYRNITDKFPDYHLQFRNIANRTIIESDSADRLAEDIALTIFGISYTAPIYLFKWTDHQHLTSTVISFASKIISPGQRFGFDARTTGPNRPSSQELKVELGSLLYDAFDGSLTVDLTNPDFLFTVEVREEYAWVYYKTIHGFDGFPQGAQKGIPFGILRQWLPDYIATFLAMKRGVNARPVRFITSEVDQQSDYQQWHEKFIDKFSFRSSIDVPMVDLLQDWKKDFGDNLCSACMFFSEKLLAEVSSSNDGLGFISGLKLESLNGDISSSSLKWFEENISTFKIRPIITSNTDELAQNSVFQSFPDSKACCSFQDKRIIRYNLTEDEKNKISSSIISYQTKYFEKFLKKTTSAK